MADRTTITVNSDTKRLLDEQRDGRSWDQFLQDLATAGSTEDSSDPVIIHPDSVEEIASITADRTAGELENRFR